MVGIDEVDLVIFCVQQYDLIVGCGQFDVFDGVLSFCLEIGDELVQ